MKSIVISGLIVAAAFTGIGWTHWEQTTPSTVLLEAPQVVLLSASVEALVKRSEEHANQLRQVANARYVTVQISQWRDIQGRWRPDLTLGEIARSYNPGLSSEQIGEIVESLLSSAERYEVDPLLMAAVIAHESRFRPEIVSPGGAVGLGQLMPATAARLGVDPFSPAQNIEGATKYLGSHLKRWSGRDAPERLALASYNAGPGAVEEWGGVPPYSATRHYVESISSRYKRFRDQAEDDKSRWLKANGPPMRDLFGRKFSGPVSKAGPAQPRH